MVVSIVASLAVTICMTLEFATIPTARIETIEPTALHLAGECIKTNVGSVVASDDFVTVRVVGN